MNKSVGLLTMEKMDNRLLNSVGSSRIRMRWLLPYWEEAEEYVIGKKYDVMVFQKVYWGAMMDKYEGIKILDLCDPDWLENKPVFEFVDKVDAVTTSTELIADFVRKMRPGKIVKYIPDRVYLPECVPIKTDFSDTLKTVVWFGYSHNIHYLLRVFDELIKHNLTLIAISDSHIDPPIAYKGKIKIENITYNYLTVNKELVKYDAVLMPDPYGDEKAKFKSTNKTLQAWSLGMPVIKVPDDIIRLASKEVRMKESEENLKKIREYYDIKKSVDEYKSLIEEIKKVKKYVQASS